MLTFDGGGKAVKIILPAGGCPAEVLGVLRWHAGSYLSAVAVANALRVRRDRGFARAYLLAEVQEALRLLTAAECVEASNAGGGG
jgi:hypothetical protein